MVPPVPDLVSGASGDGGRSRAAARRGGAGCGRHSRVRDVM